MKPKTLGLCIILLMLLIGVTSFGASRIVLDEVIGAYDATTLRANCSVTFVFRLTNTDGNTIAGLTNGYKIWTHDYSGYTDGFMQPNGFLWAGSGLQSMLDGGFFIEYYGADGIGAETVGFGGFKLFGTGIPDGYDKQVYAIETTPLYDGDVLCIDSSWYPPSGTWTWGTSGGNIIPEWSGPYCYDIFLCPCGTVDLSTSSTSYTFGTCSETQFLIIGVNTTFPNSPVDIHEIWGPGTVTQLDDTSAIWSYHPSAADIDHPQTLKIQAYCEGACGSKLITVNFYAEPLTLVYGCDDTVQIDAGELATHQLTSCISADFYAADINPIPSGSLDIDNSGLITFSTSPDDRGLYVIEGCATDNIDTVCCSVAFFVTSDICLNRGNVDGIIGAGGSVDVADLTYLVAYLFDGGNPPPCPDEGNIDGMTGAGGPIDITDLTFLVAYLFNGGPPPPPC